MMRRLYDRGLTTSLGGNISLRVDDDLFLVTPSGLDKASLEPDMIALVTLSGENLDPDLKLSIETEMHRMILMNRSDVTAVVHSHPLYASAFSAMAGFPVDTALTAEAWWQLQKPALVPYRKMGSRALAEAVAAAAKEHDVLAMENHGVVCLGSSLLSAFEKMDVLERACRMTTIAWQATQSGIAVRDLGPSERSELR